MRYREKNRPTIRRGSIKEFFGSDSNLKGCWSLDNLIDESGNGNHGTIIGTTGGCDPFRGRFNNSYLFKQSFPPLYTDKCIDVGSNASMAVTSFTIMAWFYTTSANLYRQWIFSHLPGATLGKIDLLTWDGNAGNPNKAICQIYDTAYRWVSGNIIILPNKWYFIAVTYDGITLKLFVDGKCDNSLTYTGTFVGVAGSTYIGSQVGVSTTRYPPNGMIDESGLLSRALSPTEISQYYQWATATPRKYYLYSPEIIAGVSAAYYYSLVKQNRLGRI